MHESLRAVQIDESGVGLLSHNPVTRHWDYKARPHGSLAAFVAVEHLLAGDYWISAHECGWAINVDEEKVMNSVSGLGTEVALATRGKLPHYVFPDFDLALSPMRGTTTTRVEVRSDGVAVDDPMIGWCGCGHRVYKWTDPWAIRWLLYALLNGTMVPDSGARVFVFSGDDGAEPTDARAPQSS